MPRDIENARSVSAVNSVWPAPKKSRPATVNVALSKNLSQRPRRFKVHLPGMCLTSSMLNNDHIPEDERPRFDRAMYSCIERLRACGFDITFEEE